MTKQLVKDLALIGETPDSLYHLNSLILIWAQKRGWYITINRVPRKGWLVYGLNNDGQQLYAWCGIGVIEDHFDMPITSLNKFIKNVAN